MISDFKLISRHNNRDQIIEEYNEFLHPFFSKVSLIDTIHKLGNHFYLGISWVYENKKIELYEKLNQIESWPTYNMELLVVLFSKNSSIHPYPNNLVVFNADGSIRHIIPPPVLDTQPDKGGWFRKKKILLGNAYGIGNNNEMMISEEDVKNNLVLIYFIGGNLAVQELKLLDPYTGKFVKTLLSKEITSEMLKYGF